MKDLLQNLNRLIIKKNKNFLKKLKVYLFRTQNKKIYFKLNLIKKIKFWKLNIQLKKINLLIEK